MDGKKDASRFFQNRECRYFPCHPGVSEEEFNCLFCYCPLYMLGRKCGGSCTYTEKGTKSCKDCAFPHYRENYDRINSRFEEIRAVIRREDGTDE